MPTDQTELRARRQRGLPVRYGPEFDLAVEVRELVEGLAIRCAALSPGLWTAVRDVDTGEWRRVAFGRPRVDDVVASVVGLVEVVSALLAEGDSVRRTAHLVGAQRREAREALAELATVPEPPRISDDAVRVGDWAALLVDYVWPLGGPLGDLLGEAPELNGRGSVSEQLVAVLRRVDKACAAFDRSLSRAGADRRAGRLPGQRRRPDALEEARRRLDELGVPL